MNINLPRTFSGLVERYDERSQLGPSPDTAHLTLDTESTVLCWCEDSGLPLFRYFLFFVIVIFGWIQNLPRVWQILLALQAPGCLFALEII